MADDRERAASAALASERRLGCEQGEAFDRQLREQELTDREQRLGSSVGDLDGLYAPDASPGFDGGRPQLADLRLQDEIRHLRFFYYAVQKSRAWRFTQRLRAMVGRAW
jgi:hypothetical protein